MADTEKTEGAAEGEVLEASDFESLLKEEFKPKSDDAQEAIQTAVGTLAEFALRETTVISEDVIETINAMVAEIDQKLTDQINLILTVLSQSPILLVGIIEITLKLCLG